MRFIVMHKVDPTMEAGGPPDQKIIQEMGRLVGSSIKEGVFLDGAGLHRSAQRVRVTFAGGQHTVTRGPLTGGNELVASLAMIQARSMDDAIETAGRFAGVLGDVEIEIGPVVEAWDLGLMAKPANLEGGKFLLLRKADARSEADAGPSPEVKAALRKLTAELTRAGILLKSEVLAPSKQAKRLAAGPGKRTWVDGPFAESKELIAGFSILELPTWADALAWADRYAGILGPINEVDVRLMFEPEDA
jgi:hypothetical protein